MCSAGFSHTEAVDELLAALSVASGKLSDVLLCIAKFWWFKEEVSRVQAARLSHLCRVSAGLPAPVRTVTLHMQASRPTQSFS